MFLGFEISIKFNFFCYCRPISRAPRRDFLQFELMKQTRNRQKTVRIFGLKITIPAEKSMNNLLFLKKLYSNVHCFYVLCISYVL
jgi:hypothetical protein